MTRSEAISPELVLVCPELKPDAPDAVPAHEEPAVEARVAWMLPAVPFGVAALAILTYAAAALVP